MMYNKKKFLIGIILIIVASISMSSYAHEVKLKKLVWPFEGLFGNFDRQAAQRGAQVYFEVCAACHGLSQLYYRNLREIGFSDMEVAALASHYNVMGSPDESGEVVERPAIPSDHIVSPYPNEQAARSANNGAYPVDLSLIVKARFDGANHVYSILTGYTDPPEEAELMPGIYHTAGLSLAMPPPLFDDQVTYMDDTKATVEQMAKDVVVFLQWAAEPEMEHRKSMGIKVMLFLIIFTILFYLSKNNIWKRLNKDKKNK